MVKKWDENTELLQRWTPLKEGSEEKKHTVHAAGSSHLLYPSDH